MPRLREIAGGLITGAFALSMVLPGSAQTPGTAADPDPRTQLAAVTPGSEDLPTGYTFVGETLLTANQVSGPGIDAATLQESGFVTQYVSVYENSDSGDRIRAYASLWEDDGSAEAGFAILEDEAATNPNDAMEDSGAEVGEEPRETTTGSYLDAEGTTIGTVDVTFRRGPMVIGVAHEKTDGSAADAAIATELATRLDERAQSVLNGESPEHTDLSLPSRAISFATEGNPVVQAGFLGPVEVESIYGVQGSLLSSVDASWIETTIIGSTELSSPTVTIGVTSFGSAEDAQFTVEQASDLFAPLQNQEEAEAPAIDGASATAAFRYSSNGDSLDSYRLLFATDTTMTVIDLQNAASEEGAEEAATVISGAQLTCQVDGACEVPTLPTSFTGQ